MAHSAVDSRPFLQFADQLHFSGMCCSRQHYTGRIFVFAQSSTIGVNMEAWGQYLEVDCILQKTASPDKCCFNGEQSDVQLGRANFA